jgi:NADPH-dependent 2,4-dienoyl-CoA reductase/sulfur reductase-like enzyme
LILNNIVVVGAGVTGVRAVQALRRQGYDGRLTLVAAHEDLPYNLPPLSKELLVGDLDEDEIRLIQRPHLMDLRIELELGASATALDVERRILRTKRTEIPFDGLIIATGSQPIWPRAWPPLQGVTTLRTLDDARILREALTAGSPRVVIIGGGFIGCEVASAARRFGLDTTIVEAAPYPLHRALDSELAKPILRMHVEHGVRMKCGVGVSKLLGSERVEQVELTDGSVIDADLVLIAIGAGPVTDWLIGSGVEITDGVAVDATLATSVPYIYAAGDVARWPDRITGHSTRVEHWTNASEQGTRAARNLLEPSKAIPYNGIPYVWSDQQGRRIQIAGHSQLGEARFLIGSPDGDSYLAVLVKDDRVVGAVGFDRPGLEFKRARRLVSESASWSEVDVHDWVDA